MANPNKEMHKVLVRLMTRSMEGPSELDKMFDNFDGITKRKMSDEDEKKARKASKILVKKIEKCRADGKGPGDLEWDIAHKEYKRTMQRINAWKKWTIKVPLDQR